MADGYIICKHKKEAAYVIIVRQPLRVTAAGLLFGFLPDVENISVVRSVSAVVFDLLPH